MSVQVRVKDTGNLADILSEAAGAEQIKTYVRIYKVSRRARALVRPRSCIPNLVRQIVHRKVEELGGTWESEREMWEVPLTCR